MEIDVTHMVDDADAMCMLSGSAMEHGQDAGRITWNNSVDYGRNHPLLTTDEQRDGARKYFREFGAWTEEEIATWSEDDLQGLACQDVASAIRDMESAGSYEDYEAGCESGRYSGNLYKSDGRWYFYMGW